MVVRRIVASVCALCLVAPAAAIASPGTDPPKAKGPYGVVAATGPVLAARARGPYGGTPVARPVLAARARGPYGLTPAAGPVLAARARGPYGLMPGAGAPSSAGPTAHPAVAARSNATTAWRIAAISEAALLAALAFGLVGLAGARRRAPRMVT